MVRFVRMKIVVSMRLVVKPGAELTTVADSKVRLCYQQLQLPISMKARNLRLTEKSSDKIHCQQ